MQSVFISATTKDLQWPGDMSPTSCFASAIIPSQNTATRRSPTKWICV